MGVQYSKLQIPGWFAQLLRNKLTDVELCGSQEGDPFTRLTPDLKGKNPPPYKFLLL